MRRAREPGERGWPVYRDPDDGDDFWDIVEAMDMEYDAIARTPLERLAEIWHMQLHHARIYQRAAQRLVGRVNKAQHAREVRRLALGVQP